MQDFAALSMPADFVNGLLRPQSLACAHPTALPVPLRMERTPLRREKGGHTGLMGKLGSQAKPVCNIAPRVPPLKDGGSPDRPVPIKSPGREHILSNVLGLGIIAKPRK